MVEAQGPAQGGSGVVSKAVGSLKKLAQLIKRLRAADRTEAGAQDAPTLFQHAPGSLGEPIITELVYSLLLGDSSTSAARSAMKRLTEGVVDANELRVWMPTEIASCIGERYPAACERALRIKSSLWEIQRRQHVVSLEHLTGQPAREARAYLDSIEGVTKFAASRVALGCLSIPCVPLDARLAALLTHEGVLEDDAPLNEASSWLIRNIEPADAGLIHKLFQSWSDEEGHAPKPQDHTTTDAPAKRRPGKAAPRPAKARTTSTRSAKSTSSPRSSKSKG
jgi:hypothetical protein